mgnify:CR=1 FL=1
MSAIQGIKGVNLSIVTPQVGAILFLTCVCSPFKRRDLISGLRRVDEPFPINGGPANNTVSNVLATSLKDNGRKTKKASKVGKLRLTFVVNENRISNTESKVVYLVLTNPLGDVVEGGSNSDVLSTKKEGEKLYTSKNNIDYKTGLIQNVSFDTDFSKILVDGLYKVQLYENGYKISETRLVLKKNKICELDYISFGGLMSCLRKQVNY